MEEFSLLKILRNDPDFSEALKKKIENVKEDKNHLLTAANQYNEKYHDEIVEGTKLYQKLLSEGESKGLTEEQVFKGSSKFLPTVKTPILNYLFFIMRDEPPTKTIQELLEEYIKKFGYEKSEITDLYLKGIAENVDELDIEEHATEFEDEVSDENTKEVDEQDKFIYGNLDHTIYKKIKKLKRLIKSPNQNESALAYVKCRELCDKYNLDFRKIND